MQATSTFRLSRFCVFAALVASTAASLTATEVTLFDQLQELDYKSETGDLKLSILQSMRSNEGLADWEQGLLQVLSDPEASTDGRLLAAELLKQCLRAENAEALLPLLADNRFAHVVRDLISGFENEAIDAALIDVLPSVSGRYRMGILATLAERRSEAAVPAILNMVRSDQNPETVALALRTLGNIGGESTGQFFAEHRDWLKQPALLANAYAEGALCWLTHEQASTWIGAKSFDRLTAALIEHAPDEAVRQAAYRIQQRAHPDDFRQFLKWMQSDSELERKRAAVGIPLLERSEKLKSTLKAQLGSWHEQAQVFVMEGMLDVGDEVALELAREQFDPENGSRSVNEACFRVFAAMGHLQDAQQLLPISLSEDALSAPASAALAMIPDAQVAPWLMQEFADGDEATREGVLSLIIGRGMRDELATLLAKADSYPRSLQRSIYRAIGTIGNLEMVDELMRQRQTATDAQNDIERAVVDIGRRFPTPIVSERLIADWSVATGAEKDRLLRMIGAIDQPNSIELLGELIMEPQPNAIALRSINAMDAFDAFDPLQQFLKRDDVSAQDLKASWRALFRITRRAMETWRDDRNDFWEVAHDCAPGVDEVGVMIAYTTEAMRGEFVPWLEELSVPELEAQRMEALQKLKKEFGLE